MKSILKWKFWKTLGVVALGHVLCDNIWWILGYNQIGKWWYMPVVITFISLFVAIIVEKRIHA